MVARAIPTADDIVRFAIEQMGYVAAVCFEYAEHTPLRTDDAMDIGGDWWVLAAAQTADDAMEVVCRRRSRGELLAALELSAMRGKADLAAAINKV